MDEPATTIENRRTATGRTMLPVLRVVAGVGAGREHPLDRPSMLLGKSRDADIRSICSGLSRVHAKFLVSTGAVTVVDLGSTNGTQVNGTRIERAQLREGDRIRMGPDLEVELVLVAGPAASPLTPRELEVAALVGRGMSNAEAANELGVSPRTIGRHLEKIFDRLGVRSRVEVARHAIELGLVVGARHCD